MKTDVYNSIISLVDKTLNKKKVKEFDLILALTSIAAICTGAIQSEKGTNNEKNNVNAD